MRVTLQLNLRISFTPPRYKLRVVSVLQIGKWQNSLSESQFLSISLLWHPSCLFLWLKPTGKINCLTVAMKCQVWFLYKNCTTGVSSQCNMTSSFIPICRSNRFRQYKYRPICDYVESFTVKHLSMWVIKKHLTELSLPSDRILQKLTEKKICK